MIQSMARGFDTLHWDPPLLRGLTEVEFIRDILSAEELDGISHQEIQGFEARILKKHLRKTVIDYNVKFTNSTKNYIGLYRESDERLEHAFKVLKTLRSNGFGGDSKLIVPAPVLYLPALSFLMMEKAQGEPLRNVFDRKEDPIPYVRGAAQWLAKLHGSNVAFDGTRSREDEIDASLRFTRAASWLFPRFKSEVQSISKQLVGALESFRPRLGKSIHGDYHPRNIIVSPELTTAVDFDEARMGDPAFDLGFFVAQTKMTHGTGPTTIQATETFLQEYRESQPAAEGNFSQRVAVFEAQTYLQRIYHTYYLLALKPNFDLIAKWLNESKTCLQNARSRV